VELFFPEARRRKVGILARVPPAGGKLTRDSEFEAGEHRKFNRKGEAFDMGETFSGSITMWRSRRRRRFGK
jgi:hypothetical protein